MRRKYITAIWREWRKQDDGNWYVWLAEALALRLKATLCVVLNLRRTHDYKIEWFGVGAVDVLGPYADYYNGGQQATWTEIAVTRYWHQWAFTTYEDAWQ